MKFILGLISSIIAVIVFVPYFWDIFKKKTQPHMYSWLIWGLLQLIGAAALFKGGAGYGALALFVGAILCLGVFVLSFKYGTKNIKRFDVLCLVGALFALVLYVFVKNPLYSVILITVVDFTAFLPTFRKGYEEPYSETRSAFLLSACSQILTLFALEHYSFTTVLYVASLFITNSILVAILTFKRM
jgi:hypothetical protein